MANPQSTENLTAKDRRRRVVTAELRLSIAARVPRAKIFCAGPFRHPVHDHSRDSGGKLMPFFRLSPYSPGYG
jgi:hypothetical protein